MSKRVRGLSPASMSKRRRAGHPFVPKKIATAEAAAMAQDNPPFLRLLAETRNVVQNPQQGKSIVYWMRMGDLRIVDNRALAAASKQAVQDRIPLIVLFLLSPQDYIAHDRSKRRIDFMLRNLSEIKESLARLDIPLLTISHTPRHSTPSKVISLLESFQCTRLFANMEYEVDELRRDSKVLALSKERGIWPHYFHDRCIIEPGLITTKDGKAHATYFPYQRVWIAKLNEKISTYLEEFSLPKANPSSVRQDPIFGALFYTPVPRSVEGFELDSADRETMAKVWPAGTAAAQEILSRFLNTKARSSQLGTANPLADGAETSDERSRIVMYTKKRDRGDEDATSRLSPYLSAGVISPRECIRATITLTGLKKVDAGRITGVGCWVQELAWRDFYTNVLAYFPRVSMGRPFQEKLAIVRWEVNEDHLVAWKQGKTGVPIVDAAMRQMNTMGWMHNRMRMIAAMFLTKDLLLDWHLGEQYFMEQLIDGDLASNNGGWQWSASTGVDPAPYFRIFNPYTQSSKADPTGEYIRTYVPELKNLRGPELYNPSAKIADKLGYPRPVVVHAEVRERAIRRYQNPGEENTVDLVRQALGWASLSGIVHMDAKINSLASRVVDSNRAREEIEDDDDAIFAELEADIENDDSATLREHGLEQLRLRTNKLKDMQQNAHGSYTEITNEKEVIRISANEPRCIIHFYHGNFRRCEIMDEHLAKLAPKYFATRFIRVFVENVPWLVERLSIQVLPCVMCFMDGISKDRLIGFEELGNSDVFETAVLELRLSQSGVLQKVENPFNVTYSTGHRDSARGNTRKGKEDDEDFDLDD